MPQAGGRVRDVTAHGAPPRARTRALLLGICAAVVLSTVGTGAVAVSSWPLFAGTAVVGLGWLGASLWRKAHPVLDVAAPVLATGLLIGVLASTGGLASPYAGLLLMPPLYATLYHDRRHAALIVVACFAGYVLLLLRQDSSTLGWVGVAATVVPLAAALTVLAAALTRIRDAADRDSLTGLWNHAAFYRLTAAEHARADRGGPPYAVLMVDIDHFKRTNDRHGHLFGDRVLKRVAHTLLSRARAGDVLARYGGEEFALLLPHSSEEGAVVAADDLRRCVEEGDHLVPITVSIGVAALETFPNDDVDQLVDRADRALYEAKTAGRNAVAVAGKR